MVAVKTGRPRCKLKALLGLGECSLRVRNAETAVVFLKRALQYCWLTRQTFEELLVYEKLSLGYYYLGDVKKAYAFHQRAARGDTEDDNSPIKMISQENINDYDRHTNKNRFSHISTLLLLNISLPMLTVQEFPFLQSQTRKEYEFAKNRYFQQAKATQIIDALVQNDLEF